MKFKLINLLIDARISFPCMGFCACIVLGIAGAATAETSDSFIQGVKFYKSGDYANAIPIFQKIVAVEPLNHSARNNLAASLIKVKQYKLAEQHLLQILKAAPTKANSRQNLGVALGSESDLDQAIAETNRSIALHVAQQATRKTHAEALYNRGWLLDEQDNPEEAIGQYELAIEYWPGYAKAWIALAVALAKQGRFEVAREAVETASRLTGKNDVLKLLVAHNREAIEIAASK